MILALKIRRDALKLCSCSKLVLAQVVFTWIFKLNFYNFPIDESSSLCRFLLVKFHEMDFVIPGRVGILQICESFFLLLND